MEEVKELLTKYRDKKIALYGLGTETERFLSVVGNRMSIVGLLDGFKVCGEIYGYPILSMQEVLSKGAALILVVARPGSCKVIAKRIRGFCLENGIALYDIRGKNLLEAQTVSYDFHHLAGKTVQELLDAIDKADVVSFDLFDTLVTRKVYSYTDVFALLDWKLREKGIYIPDFVRLRLSAEKELSRNKAPKLEAIYEDVLKKTGGNFITASALAGMEWEMDRSVMAAREGVGDVFRKAVSAGKQVVVTTDSYYCLEQIEEILEQFGWIGYDKVLVSCEYGTSKTQDLFAVLQNTYKAKKILHIGDDEAADIEKAGEHGIDTYRIFSGADLFDALGGLGIEGNLATLADRLKAGMFISHLLNSPFWFEDRNCALFAEDAFAVGYLFCAPVITDFVLWMKEKIEIQDFQQILFCARDGYLIGQLFKKVSPQTRSVYFLASRTAAIRAGVENEEDLAYVDSMNYSGGSDESRKARFGITVDSQKKREWDKEILSKAVIQRDNYKKYIKKLELRDNPIALFDFVAKGTVQMYLQKLFPQEIKGFYFLQLEPEFMADKGLDIQPFYADEEKNTSMIFDNYYLLETILTSPYAQTEEFDKEGRPVFAAETRSERDIRCFERAQEGILAYFEDYLRILPEGAREENKTLDELFLALISKIPINDEDFLALNVEDPFFGRMTDIKDVIG